MISIATPACLARIAARLGWLRILNPLNLSGDDEAGARTVALTYRVEPMAALCAQVRGLPRSIAEFAAAPPLASDLPMTVLTATSLRGMLPASLESRIAGLGPQWRAMQEQLSTRSTRSRWEIVEGDHLLASTAPAAVSSAILDLLAAVRR